MRHFRLSALPVPLLACFTTLTCMGAGSALWTLYQFSPSPSYTVAVGQKFSLPADYFYAVRLWVWVQIGGMACVAALLAWRLHATTAAPLQAALAAGRRMASGDLAAQMTGSSGLQNNELLSTMQEMNTCISEIFAKARQQNDSLAGLASDLARSSLQGVARSAELGAVLDQAAQPAALLAAAAGRCRDLAQPLSALNDAAAESATDAAAMTATIGRQLATADAGARRAAQLQHGLETLARSGQTLARRSAFDAACGGAGAGLLAQDMRALAERMGAAARTARELASQARQQAATMRAMHVQAERSAKVAASGAGRARAVAAALSAEAAAQHEQAHTLCQALTAADEARRRAAALSGQSAATAAALRDQAGDLVRTLSRVTLAPAYGSSALIRLAHSTGTAPLARAHAAGARRAHLISIL